MAHPVSLGPVSLVAAWVRTGSEGRRNPPSQSGESVSTNWRPYRLPPPTSPAMGLPQRGKTEIITH